MLEADTGVGSGHVLKEAQNGLADGLGVKARELENKRGFQDGSKVFWSKQLKA